MQKSIFAQSNSVRAVWDFLALLSVFVRQNVTITENKIL